MIMEMQEKIDHLKDVLKHNEALAEEEKKKMVHKVEQKSLNKLKVSAPRTINLIQQPCKLQRFDLVAPILKRIDITPSTSFSSSSDREIPEPQVKKRKGSRIAQFFGC